MILGRRSPYPDHLGIAPPRLLDDRSTRSSCLGCVNCVDRDRCGGLSVAASVFNCMDYCCGSPSNCDLVCPLAPQIFQNRIREIQGFDMSTISQVQALKWPDLPSVIPLIYHRYRRQRSLRAEAVALSLYQLYDRRTGLPRYSTREQLAAAFRIDPGSTLLLTGTDCDKTIENWWSKVDERLLRNLELLGIDLVTTPNFSLFTNVPRWDNLHSIKRIALSWELLMRAGICAAPHINARNDTDYLNWTEFVIRHPEIKHIAFEFGTGAGYKGRTDWHIAHLLRFAADVARPLGIVLRGRSVAPQLIHAFARVTLIETDSFTKTLRRQRATALGNDLRWSPNPTAQFEPLDELLAHNVANVRAATEAKLVSDRAPSAPSGAPAAHRDYKSGEVSLLNQPGLA
jgi:hypothetical protein